MDDATTTRAELDRALHEADCETRALLESLSDDDLAKRTGESNWTVGQLAGHVAQAPWATYLVGKLTQNKNASAPGPLSFLLDLGNWWTTRKYAKTSKAELLQTWDKQFTEYSQYVAGLPDDVLENGGEVPGRGRMTVADFVRAAPDHTRQHADTIKQALGS